MRRERWTRATTAFLAGLALVSIGCSSGGEGSDDTAAEEVSSTRRSDNEGACEQLQVVADIEAETGRLSSDVARLVVVGAEGPVLLEAAGALADHLRSTHPQVIAAYAEASAVAPEAVAAAIDELAAGSAATVPGLIELLDSPDATVISNLYESFGALGGPQDPDVDPGAVEEVERYTSVICDMPSPG